MDRPSWGESLIKVRELLAVIREKGYALLAAW